MLYPSWRLKPPSDSHSPSASNINAFDARFEVIENLLTEQAQRLNDLETRLSTLGNAQADLQHVQEQMCECALASNTLAIMPLRRRLARQRSRAALRAALHQPQLALSICHAAGFAAMYYASATCGLFHECLSAVFSDVLELVTPVVCRIGGFQGAFPSAARTAEFFDPVANVWEILPPMKTGRIACAAVPFAGNLYVFGGCNAGLEDLPSAECYQPDTGRWEELPPMPAARRLCTAAPLGGKIYVFGRGPNSESVSVPIGFCFDPPTKAWSQMPKMPLANIPCAAVASLGKLYMLSCVDENAPAAPTAERYNPATREWEVLPSIPTPRRSFAAAAVSGQLYVCGGMSIGPDSQPLNMVERLNPADGVWEMLPGMGSQRGACAGAAAGAAVYVVGGSVDDVLPLATAERFDIARGCWEPLPMMWRESLLCAATGAGFLLRPRLPTRSPANSRQPEPEEVYFTISANNTITV